MYSSPLHSLAFFLASHMVLGLIFAFSCNLFSFSSIFFVSASSIRCLSFFWLSRYSFFVAILFPSLPDLHAVWNLSRISFFIFRASLISLLLVLWGLSVLILFIPTVFFSISLIVFSASLYVPFLILFLFSSCWIVLLNCFHPSLLFSLHFSWYVGFLGSFIAIDIVIVLWSVSFFPFILRWPSSSTIRVWMLFAT